MCVYVCVCEGGWTVRGGVYMVIFEAAYKVATDTDISAALWEPAPTYYIGYFYIYDDEHLLIYEVFCILFHKASLGIS